jgi:hypothetical protein
MYDCVCNENQTNKIDLHVHCVQIISFIFLLSLLGKPSTPASPVVHYCRAALPQPLSADLVATEHASFPSTSAPLLVLPSYPSLFRSQPCRSRRDRSPGGVRKAAAAADATAVDESTYASNESRQRTTLVLTMGRHKMVVGNGHAGTETRDAGYYLINKERKS